MDDGRLHWSLSRYWFWVLNWDLDLLADWNPLLSHLCVLCDGLSVFGNKVAGFVVVEKQRCN